MYVGGGSGATQTILPQVALGFGLETQATPAGRRKEQQELGAKSSPTPASLDRDLADFRLQPVNDMPGIGGLTEVLTGLLIIIHHSIIASVCIYIYIYTHIYLVFEIFVN